MSNPKIADIRTQEAAELEFQLKEHRKRIFELRFKAASEEIADNKELQRRRRDVARILTIQNERRLGLNPASRDGGAAKAAAPAAKAPAAKPEPAAASAKPAAKPGSKKPAKKSAKSSGAKKASKSGRAMAAAKSSKAKKQKKESDGR